MRSDAACVVAFPEIVLGIPARLGGIAQSRSVSNVVKAQPLSVVQKEALVCRDCNAVRLMAVSARGVDGQEETRENRSGAVYASPRG